MAIDYQNEDFLAHVREDGGGVDVVVDSLGGPISLRSFRALRPGGRLVVFGRYSTIKEGHKDWPAVIKWYAAIATVWLWDKVSPRRHVYAYSRPEVPRQGDEARRSSRRGADGRRQFREDFAVLVELLRADKIHPVVAERLPLAEARRAHEMLGELGGDGEARPRAVADEDAREMAQDLRVGPVDRVMSGGARRTPGARYLPIAEHGLIGDLHTVALVGTDGTIDWYCCPRFDSPSVFAAILDADRGGLFRIAPAGEGWSSKQLYLPDTNVLITRFLTPEGVGEVQDFMPPASTGEAAHRHRMIRRVLAVRGQMRFVVDVAPRFDYARVRHEVARTPHGVLFRTPELALHLSTRCPLEIVDGGDVRARVAPPDRGDGHLCARPRRARGGAGAALRCRHRCRSSTPPWRSGGGGCAARATAGVGARW